MELQKNHPLQGGKYRIIEKIGQGGFAITYKANWSTELSGPMGKIATDITVAIKEFFFADYCSRDNDSSQIITSSPTGAQIFDKFKEKLKKEAAILSRLRHPNIVSVLDIFEENNTVYMVMEYISGGSLKDVIRKNGKLDEPTTLRYASQLCDAVAEIHRNNVLHLDIKPGNILINNDDKVCLIDFGISKQYNSDTHAETSTTPVGISKGFAPTEQYSGVAQFSPATDIYAIGATIYNMCSGNIPPEAVSLLDEDLPKINGISDQLWNAIIKAMSVRRNQRPQSIAELVALLPSANSAKESTTQQSVTDNEKTQIASQISRNSLDSQQELDEESTFVSTKNEKLEFSKINEHDQILNQDLEDQEEATTEEKTKKWNLILIFGGLVATIIIAYILFSSDNSSVTIEASPDSTAVTYSVSDSSIVDSPTIVSTKTEPTDISPKDEKQKEIVGLEEKSKTEVQATKIKNSDNNKSAYQTPPEATNTKVANTAETKVESKSEPKAEPKSEPKAEPMADSNKIFTAIEQNAQFPGGDAALFRWLSAHIYYPPKAQEKNIQGRVTVQFVVEKDGSIGTVKIARSVHPDLDKEAIRVVKSLPKFIPGKNNGTPVRCWFTLPITFRLQQ